MLLLGTDEQIAAARAFVLDAQPQDAGPDTFRDLAVELVEVPPGAPVAGRSLAELNWPRLLGVQVVGHERDGARTITPTGELRIEAGDRILVLGTPAQVSLLRDRLAPASP